MTEPDVCVVTVTYGRRWHLLRQVLHELVSHHEKISKIIVVDNDLAEPISELVNESGWAPKVNVVRLGHNAGSAGGFGAGLQAGMQSGARLLWLLDDDNRPRPGALDRLLFAYSMMGEDPSVLLQSYRGDRYQYVVAATEGRFVGIIPNSFQGLHVGNIPLKLLNQFRSRSKKLAYDFRVSRLIVLRTADCCYRGTGSSKLAYQTRISLFTWMIMNLPIASQKHRDEFIFARRAKSRT